MQMVVYSLKKSNDSSCMKQCLLNGGLESYEHVKSISKDLTWEEKIRFHLQWVSKAQFIVDWKHACLFFLFFPERKSFH